MAGPRAIWKGVLHLSLLRIPIAVYAATEPSTGMSFNQLHGACQTRIQQKKYCPKCERGITEAEIVKGFEFEPGKYVLLLDAELDAVQPPSLKAINLERVAVASALLPVSIDRSYYVLPHGEVESHAAHAYALFCAVMVGKVGIGKLAIYGREYLVAVGPQGSTLMLYTLHPAAAIRTAPVVALEALTDPELTLGGQLVSAFTRPLNLAAFRDEYRADVQKLIEAKIAGEEIVEVAPVPTVPVLPLLEALTQSLQLVDRRAVKRVQVKVTTPTKRKRA